MIDRKHCAGCRNDFYNVGTGAALSPEGRCWSRDEAKVIRRFQIHIDVPMSQPGAFVEVKRPDCYHATGLVFFKQPPPNAVKPRRLPGRRP